MTETSREALPPITGVLFDLDGTLAVAGEPIAGAAEAVSAIRARGVPIGLVTNTTRLSRRLLSERLGAAGFVFAPQEIFTVPTIAALWLRQEGLRRVLPVMPQVAREDLEDLEIVEPSAGGNDPADAVLVGDPGPELSYEALNGAFRAVMVGARLVACQRNRYWQEADGLSIDAGALVVALEYATGAEAVLVGKPSPSFFHLAVGSLGGPVAAAVLMVGDDIEGDVRGAQGAGLRGCLVRTGKYRPQDLDRPGSAPDLVVDSVASLPGVLFG